MSESFEVLRPRGDAPPLACFHGFLGAPGSWRPIVDRLPGPVALARLPGHGPDPWTPERAGFDDVLDAFAEALPFEEPTWLAGYSMGARVALGLAVRHPSRVRGALLIGAQPGLRTAAERAARVAWEDDLSRRVVAQGIAAFAGAWAALPLFASQAALPGPVREAQRRSRLAHTERGIAWALGALGLGGMPSLWEALPTCPVPLVFVAGALDAKFTALAQQAASLARRGSVRAIAGAGHNAGLEAPDALADLLVEVRS